MNNLGITVGVITINDNTNYGNRLQNYAITKLLENEGVKVINGIVVFTKTDWIKQTRNPLKRLIKSFVPFKAAIKKVYVEPKEKDGLLKKREDRFKAFTNSYTQTIEPIIVSNYLKANSVLNKYAIDYYIAGSDQIWNPFFEAKGYEFVSFAPKFKRLSFSASIGVDAIPQETV